MLQFGLSRWRANGLLTIITWRRRKGAAAQLFSSVAAGELVLRTRKVRVPFGGLNTTDYKGNVLIAERFVRFASGLDSAPCVPPSVLNWLAERPLGLRRGHRKACPGDQSAVAMRRWAMHVLRHCTNSGR